MSTPPCGLRNPTWAKLTSLARALHVPVSAIVQTAEREAEIALIVGAARACASGRLPAP